jgi:uncharacterized protein YjbI with pentapeptide repeats
MKNLKTIGISIALATIAVSACGGSSDTSNRTKNMAPATNVAMATCTPSANANCEGVWFGDRLSIRNRTASTNWSGINLSGATITSGNVGNHQIVGANLSSAKISNLRAHGTRFSNSSFVNSTIFKFEGSTKDLPGISSYLTPAIMNQVDFSFSEISESTFGGVNLRAAKFVGAFVYSVDFSSADLTGADFSGATFLEVKGHGIIGNPKLPTGWRLIKGTLIGATANLGTDEFASFLRRAKPAAVKFRNLSGDLQSAVNKRGTSCEFFTWSKNRFDKVNTSSFGPLISSDLRGINFDGTDFSGQDLRNADFSGSTFSGVNFSGAQLSGAKFNDAKFEFVDFSFAAMSGVDLSRASLKSIKSRCVHTGSAPARLPSGWSLVSNDVRNDQFFVTRGLLLGPGTDFTGVYTAGLDLSKTDVSNADFTGAITGNLETRPVQDIKWERNAISPVIVSPNQKLPVGYGVRNGHLVGPNVDLSYTNLRNVNLDGVSLEGSVMTGLVSEKVTGNPKVDQFRRLVNGFIVGEGVDLREEQLGNADLSNLSLAGAILDRADLSQAKLDNVSSGGLLGTPILPSGWMIDQGWLLGPTANLQDAMFKERTTPVSLEGFDLTKANLDGSDLGLFQGTPKVPTGWTVLVTGRGGSLRTLVGPTSKPIDSSNQEYPPSAVLSPEYVRLDRYWFGPNVRVWGSTPVVGSLNKIDLSESTLFGLDFRGATLEGTRGVGIITLDKYPLTWPVGWGVRKGVLVGPTADLSSVELLGTDLSGIDLSGANLRGVIGRGLKFDGTTRLPMGWAIINGTLVGPEADLTNAYLSKVNLNGVDLSEAVLSNSVFKGITGTPILPKQISLVRGVIVGSGTNIVCSDIDSREVPESANSADRVNAFFDPEKFGFPKASSNLRQPIPCK